MGPDGPIAEPLGDNAPQIPHFDSSDPVDRVAFRDVLERLAPIDQRIAAMVMEGWTQAEIGAAVVLERSWVSRRIKKMRELFVS